MGTRNRGLEKKSLETLPNPMLAYYKSSPAFLNPHLCQFLFLEHSASPFNSLILRRLLFVVKQHCATQTPNSTMKLQVAAALCLVLLVASEMVVTSQAAGCDIFQLVPCMAASKNAHAVPSSQCCTNLANMGKGLPGAKCLCSLLSSSLAKSNGVVPRIALGIPQKCRIPVPKGFVCQGNTSITHPTLLY
jgi:hypothetical protein